MMLIPAAVIIALIMIVLILAWQNERDGDWHPINSHRMRRRGPDGYWQYRDMTEDEAKDYFETMAW